ncbi:FAD-dependent oxidoreductase [Arthrobacter yangruifuii]|uniref:FAD-dependent oxidoreductase n=1 Tax=Arthrobacter yangruifuii TaxID=2606616 RepID=UPI0011B6D624
MGKGRSAVETDILVIGAGQAGLSAAYHLRRRGLAPGPGFTVLDANPGPGGAWRHRWDSLTFGAAHALHDLPGMPLGTPDPAEPASAVVTRYYERYERRFGLDVVRPVSVSAVSADSAGSGGRLSVRAADGRGWQARVVINATGTWDRPYWPYYPGRESFRGRQLHTRDFRSVADFAGQQVLVVGGGTSAVQFLLQLHRAGVRTLWSTRRPPEFTLRPFDAEWGRAVEAKVSARTRAGLPPLSVVSATGLPLTDEYRRGIEDSVLISRGPIDRLTETGVVFADGSEESVDTVLWATGFRAALDHLAPLRLREPGGGIRMDGVRVVREPRLLLVGYGESSSTLGATRAGRAAALAALQQVATEVLPR